MGKFIEKLLDYPEIILITMPILIGIGFLFFVAFSNYLEHTEFMACIEKNPVEICRKK